MWLYYKSDYTIRFPMKYQFLAFFGEKPSRPIRSLDFEIAISWELLDIFLRFLCHNFFKNSRKLTKKIFLDQIFFGVSTFQFFQFLGQNTPFYSFSPKFVQKFKKKYVWVKKQFLDFFVILWGFEMTLFVSKKRLKFILGSSLVLFWA